MWLGVLGPVVVEGPAGEIAVVGAKARQMLTLLATSAPDHVALDQAVEFLWDDPPPSAVKTVQAHVSRVRSVLAEAGAPDALTGSAAGYRLDLGDRLDVARLARLNRQGHAARAAGDPELAAQLFAEARGLWRGDPALPSSTAADALRRRLADERLELTLAVLDARVAAGAAEQAVAELGELVAAEPYNERAWELRISALYRSGRPTEALRAYQDVVSLLADDIGVVPGPALRELEARILAHEPLPEPGRHTRPTRRVQPESDIAYAHGTGGHVAYRTFGHGEPTILMINPGLLSIDALLDHPLPADAVERLAQHRRVVTFDPRGIGLSDRTQPPETFTVEQWARDAVAVLDAAGVETAHVFASGYGGLAALTVAAQHRHRVRSVALMNAFARATRAVDYPHGFRPAMHDALTSTLQTTADSKVDALTLISPSVAADPAYRRWWDSAGRRAASPAAAHALMATMTQADVRELLASIDVPALVIVRNGCPVYDAEHGSYLVAHLPHATLEEHDDINDPWFVGRTDLVVDAIERFHRTLATA